MLLLFLGGLSLVEIMDIKEKDTLISSLIVLWNLILLPLYYYLILHFLNSCSVHSVHFPQVRLVEKTGWIVLTPSSIQFSSVQSLSHVWLFVTAWTAAHRASLPITNYQSLLKPMSIESVMPSNHLILCPPLLLLPSIFPSSRVFSNEWALHIRWPKYWSFSFSISCSNEHSGLISFRMDWLDLNAVQGTLKSLLQHHSSKASIVQNSDSYPEAKSQGKAFFFFFNLGV